MNPPVFKYLILLLDTYYLITQKNYIYIKNVTLRGFMLSESYNDAKQAFR